MRRLPCNCLIFGMWIWARSRFRSFIALGRSVSMHGLVPHGRVYGETKDGLYLIEYAPPRHRRKLRIRDEGESALLFYGEVTLRKYVLVKEVTGQSLSETARKLAES